MCACLYVAYSRWARCITQQRLNVSVSHVTLNRFCNEAWTDSVSGLGGDEAKKVLLSHQKCSIMFQLQLQAIYLADVWSRLEEQ